MNFSLQVFVGLTLVALVSALALLAWPVSRE